MDRIILGRTGMGVSRAALGCAAPSRLGLATGHDINHASNPRHLHENIRAISQTPLKNEILDKLPNVFGKIDHISGS